MMSKTHVAIGIASALAISQPQTIRDCLFVVAGGAVGGVIADIDTLDNDYKSDALIGQIIAFGALAIVTLCDYLLNLGVCSDVANRGFIAIVGGIGFVILWIIGFNTNHRDFTHSFLALALYSICLTLVYPPMGPICAVAYLSHLLLDILNKKKIRLLFPVKGGVCFDVCYASKTANSVFMWIGIIASATLAVYRIFRIVSS